MEEKDWSDEVFEDEADFGRALMRNDGRKPCALCHSPIPKASQKYYRKAYDKTSPQICQGCYRRSRGGVR